MTTPPITRRCPFCGATTEHLSVRSKQGGLWMWKRVICSFCGAYGPWISYDQKSEASRLYASIACVFDWNYSDGAKSWANERKSKQHHAKRAAFIAKWSKACKGAL
jgi:hypothetical protein